MCSCHSIPECCVMFSGVKLSMGSFVLFTEVKVHYSSPVTVMPRTKPRYEVV